MVVDARYGVLDAILKAEAEERERASSEEAATSAPDVAASSDEAPAPSPGDCTLLSRLQCQLSRKPWPSFLQLKSERSPVKSNLCRGNNHHSCCNAPSPLGLE